jgi:5-methyltetrahydrofolate--homocysteine methyltransferase
MGPPLLWITAIKENPHAEPEHIDSSPDPFDIEAVARHRDYCRRHSFIDAAFPGMSVDLGPGSMALYQGCEPIFSHNTVWYTGCVPRGWESFGPLKLNECNRWWVLHKEMALRAKELAGEDFPIHIPDIMEGLDVAASMRGAQQLCYDLIDDKEKIHDVLRQLDELFYQYYDAMYSIVKQEDLSSSYTAFRIWGPGKTAKIQCDFSSVMSPRQFYEFAMPYLQRECRAFDNTLYHLDGTDAVRHLDAVLQIKELDAVQWEPGDYNADCGDTRWYPIYDKVRIAGKGLWLAFRDGGIDDWIHSAECIVDRYGSTGLYFIFPTMTEQEAEELLDRASKWK